MDSHLTRRIRLLSAVSVLGLACGVLATSAGPAGAAIKPAHAASASVRPAAAPAPRVALHGPASASVRPQTCSPSDLPYRFSGSTWTTYYLEKYANGCQSVWATSGQTFDYEVIDAYGNVVAGGVCPAGFCQLWDPATNFDPFYVWDYSHTTTSVNIYY